MPVSGLSGCFFLDGCGYFASAAAGAFFGFLSAAGAFGWGILFSFLIGSAACSRGSFTTATFCVFFIFFAAAGFLRGVASIFGRGGAGCLGPGGSASCAAECAGDVPGFSGGWVAAAAGCSVMRTGPPYGRLSRPSVFSSKQLTGATITGLVRASGTIIRDSYGATIASGG